MLHFFDKLVSCLFLALEVSPALLDGVQRVVIHPLDRAHRFLAIRVYVNIEHHVSQRHQLEYAIFDCLKQAQLSVVLGLCFLSTLLHGQTIPVRNLLALKQEDNKALHHCIHFLHDLVAGLIWVPSPAGA